MSDPKSWNELTIADLRAQGGLKWSYFPETIGAFVAEMDFGVADVVKKAATDVINEGRLGYLPLPVAAELRDALSEYLKRKYDWTVPSEWICELPDVLRALEIAFTYFMPPDAPIIVPTPSYMPFLTLPKLHGRKVIEVAGLTDADGRWRMDEAALDAAMADGGLLILCNPLNPVGRVFEREEMERIAEIVERRGGRVFSDEIHAPITYPGEQHIPYATLSEATAAHTLTATSASKAWNIPGLACAQIILSNAEDAERLHKLGHAVTRGASTPGVMANIAAYRQGDAWLSEVLGYLDGNRKFIAEKLSRELPAARYVVPEGTYLAWINLRALTNRTDLGPYLRETAGLAITDGADCGEAGNGCIRLNFATPRPILEEALNRIIATFS